MSVIKKVIKLGEIETGSLICGYPIQHELR